MTENIKKHRKNIAIVASLLLVFGLLVGGVLYFQSQISALNKELEQRELKTALKSEDELRADYYAGEVATRVSPHTMRLKMDKGEIDFVLIDVRAAVDYKAGHIRGAINIPFDGSEETINKFRQALADGKKERKTYAVIYCYSYACMLGAKTGNELARHNISVKELSVGYNDWELQHKVWNNPGEVYDINNYIERSDQPGVLEASAEFLNRPCSESDKYSC